MEDPDSGQNDPVNALALPSPSRVSTSHFVVLKFLGLGSSNLDRNKALEDNSTPCSIEVKYGDGRSVAEFLKYVIEEVSPYWWLRVLCRYANSPTQVVKVCYGDGYESTIAIDDADVHQDACTVALEASFDATNSGDEGSWAKGTDRIWDLVSNQFSISISCLYVRMVREQNNVSLFLPPDAAMEKYGTFRVWLEPSADEGEDLMDTIVPFVPLPFTEPTPFRITLRFLLSQDNTPGRLCAVMYRSQTVAEFVQHQVEVASPELWLPLILQHVDSPSKCVKLCYGDGYETTVYKYPAAIQRNGQIAAVGITFDAADANDVSWEWTNGSESMWDLVANEARRSGRRDVRVYIKLGHRRCRNPQGMSRAELAGRRRKVRVYPFEKDGHELEKMEEISPPSDARPLDRAIPTPIPARLGLLPSQLSPSSRYADLTRTDNSLCSIQYSEQTVGEFLKHQIEEVSPEFLRRIFNYVDPPNGACRILYGDGYETQVFLFGKQVKSSKSGPIVTVGLSLDPSDTSHESWEWTRGTEPLWDFVSTETKGNGTVSLFLKFGRRCCTNPPGMSGEELKTRHRKIRLFGPDNDRVFEDISSARSHPRASRPLIPSHQIVKDFLDARPESKRLDNVEGRERKSLKKLVFPHLTDKQQHRFLNDDKKGTKRDKFDKWLSETLAAVRKTTIQPEKTKNGIPKNEVGELNKNSRDRQRARNQSEAVLMSKQKHDTVRYLEKREKRQQELEMELRRNPSRNVRTPEEQRAFAWGKYTQKGLLKKWPDKSMQELVDQGIAALYFGLCCSIDRYDEETLRFLVAEDDTCPPLMWNMRPFGLFWLTKDDAELLSVGSALLDRGASYCGFEHYLMERTFQNITKDLKFGTQRLNREVGAGNTYRGERGVYSIFVTYVETKNFALFPALMINDHNGMERRFGY
eukprot:CAMPEP_0202492582 /NCGR_PEP_ID=MMETSP1361-20130828/9239_1 /ASSEMBLY_ACC=CAM_ASM_000849 /TAXON_ID=210615 /ORGANISM="Staurosira complex sp., Strain CCMP2646" /LENGTH=921 /DNA_ID=CAMNT_0049122803 /DNA_START=1071 /DNA_END=3836 /DNA_ORIENTATION=-